jgi:hypothetical protein
VALSRFKAVGIEADIEHRILDAIQGHRPRNVAEGYGEVTIKTYARLRPSRLLENCN